MCSFKSIVSTDLLMKYEEYDGYLASRERMGSYPDLALTPEDMKTRVDMVSEDMVSIITDTRVEVNHARLSPGPLTHI